MLTTVAPDSRSVPGGPRLLGIAVRLSPLALDLKRGPIIR